MLERPRIRRAGGLAAPLAVTFTAVIPEAAALPTISADNGLPIRSGTLNGPGLASASTTKAASYPLQPASLDWKLPVTSVPLPFRWTDAPSCGRADAPSR